MENYLAEFDHLFIFSYQPGKPSEHFAFNELKPVVSKLHKIDKSINFALVDNGTLGASEFD
jgi:hypothetical protein